VKKGMQHVGTCPFLSPSMWRAMLFQWKGGGWEAICCCM
jgi:hypothetical protein